MILAFGDSLTAGYGLEQSQSFAAQLERQLQAAGMQVTVINAGISGDTSAGGRSRIAWSLAQRPDLVIVELGANDALRGLDPETTRENLAVIIAQVQRAGARVLLAGMKAPRSLGSDYVTAFDQIYPDLATQYGIPLYPFFLAGVAGKPQLNLGDGIHPTAAGVAVIVEQILPLVREQLEAH